VARLVNIDRKLNFLSGLDAGEFFLAYLGGSSTSWCQEEIG